MFHRNLNTLPAILCRGFAGLGITAIACWLTYAQADTITIAAQRDTTIYENLTSNSNGMGLYLFAGQTIRDFGARRALLAFDIAGAVPAGSTIDAVALQLTVSKEPGAGPISLSLHRLNADWGEGASVAPALGGEGVEAQPGDATWLHTFFDTGLWMTGGGDFSATASATQIIAGNAAYCWDSTDTQQDNMLLISDVQFWLDNPQDNFGWILKNNDNASVSSARRFNSRENETGPPQLFITITPPPSIFIFRDGFEALEHSGCTAP